MRSSPKRRWLLLGAAVLVLGTASALDPNGLRKHLRLTEQARQLEAENRDLRLEDARLRREARALAGDAAALERAAREELGYVRPGERVYKLDEPEGSRP